MEEKLTPPLRCSFRLEERDGQWQAAVFQADEWEIGAAGVTPQEALSRLAQNLPLVIAK